MRKVPFFTIYNNVVSHYMRDYFSELFYFDYSDVISGSKIEVDSLNRLQMEQVNQLQNMLYIYCNRLGQLSNQFNYLQNFFYMAQRDDAQRQSHNKKLKQKPSLLNLFTDPLFQFLCTVQTKFSRKFLNEMELNYTPF